MNWLAHTLLSTRDIDYQLGNVLADPLRGRPWPEASLALRQGMKMHRAIDKFTDSHAIIRHSKSLLGDSGHLKGVVLDLLYDHFLSIKWQDFSVLSLDEYLLQFNQAAYETAQQYPNKPKIIVTKMSATNLLGQYNSFADFQSSLQRIDQRLSKRLKAKETATQYLPSVAEAYDDLMQDFMVFFPLLVTHFKSHKLGSTEHHFLR
ncbi:ACP phosphodiesterase [Marinicella sp. S1101]|uniref:ACP phosphodiesterase n=1 Tax=Marinicella marina TaxID=2996016 RepID=UPI0022609D52|nr:ACP phosphodiesterase [Marinicella marina]MCX7553759.1 ACP phosphodiesterase [Marinicella marina]MDJ1140834.1 ACP phosphodiesterase [Marinicella marina]